MIALVLVMVVIMVVLLVVAAVLRVMAGDLDDGRWRVESPVEPRCLV